MLDPANPDALEQALGDLADLRQQLTFSESRRQVAEVLSEERRQEIARLTEMNDTLQAALLKRFDSLDTLAMKALENAGPEKQPDLNSRFVALPRDKVQAVTNKRQRDMQEVRAIIEHYKPKKKPEVTPTTQ